jgi:hypothetical protein
LGFGLRSGSAPYLAQARFFVTNIDTFLRAQIVSAWEEDMTDPLSAIRFSVKGIIRMKDFLISLRTQAWRTSGARYNAARRLKRRELFSTVSLSFFSATTIVVAFVQRVYSTESGSTLDNYLTVLSVCLGVFLLVMSLMEWGSANGAKADVLYRNAEDLNTFQRKIAQRIAQIEEGLTLSWNDIELLREEYEMVKGRCQYNHIPLDDLMFRAYHRASSEFIRKDGRPAMGNWEAGLVLVRWNIYSVRYFAIFWVVICVVLALPLMVQK